MVLGIISASLLGILCLWGGISSTHSLMHLLQNGARTEGVVIHVQKGAKGSSRAVLQYSTAEKQVVTTRDMFQLLLIRPKKGNMVRIIYDPSQTTMATIDMGYWCWQQPALFFCGFLFITASVFFLVKKK